MIRAFAISAVALVTVALTSQSRASEACPCFTTEEILSNCPRPDAEHTESFDTGGDGKSLHVKCFATQNYSPGSIHFEAGPASEGRDAYCGRQSVEVQPYGSGGEFPPVSPAGYAACKLALGEAAKKLKLQLVMDQFSKKEILGVTYRDFVEARRKAKAWADLTPFMSSKSAKEVEDMPAEEQQMIFEFSQMLAASQGETKIIAEAIDENQAVVIGEYCSEDNKLAKHIVWHVVENGRWKVRKESHNVSSEPCDEPQTATQDAPKGANACTDEAMDKGDAKIDELIAAFPEQQRNKISDEMMDSVFNNLGDDFCSKNENICACNDEAIKYLEAR